jgi:iron complex outermembrane receptor protein
VKLVRAQSYFSQVKHWMTDQLRTSGVGTPLGYSMGTFAGSKALGGRVEAELPNAILGIETYDRGWSIVTSIRMSGVYTPQPSLPDVRMIVGGAYAQYRRSFGRLSAVVGGRLDAADSQTRSGALDTGLYWAYHSTRSTSASDVNPSGSFRLIYLLPKGIELFGGLGSTVRLPDPEERYYSLKRMGTDWVGNPTLQPTRNNEADLGINLRSRRFSLRPTLFYSRLSNFVTVRPQSKLNPVAGVMNSLARSYEEPRRGGGQPDESLLLRAPVIPAGSVPQRYAGAGTGPRLPPEPVSAVRVKAKRFA